MRKLIELNPEWAGIQRPSSGEVLHFDCPTCGPEHRLAAHFKNPRDGQPPLHSGMAWTLEDGRDFEHCTISPSIVYPCWHGWIERGQVIGIEESPITVLAKVGEETKLVSLSPLQALATAKQLIELVNTRLPEVA